MINRGLTFDDICLVPKLSEIESRSIPDISTYLTNDLPLEIPIVNSPMDSVISIQLAHILSEMGTIPIFDREVDLNSIKTFSVPFFISTGVRPNFEEINKFLDENPQCAGINVDVANGHSTIAMKTVETLKTKWVEMNVMAGNTCTAQGYRDIVNAGADVVRIGIGPGSNCTTRIVTGFGVPQFTALQNIYVERQKLGIPIIADGGIRGSGDAVKALAAGADCVMMGRLLAQTYESGALKRAKGSYIDNQVECFYRGQASRSYQEEFYGSVKTVPEGEAKWLPVTGHAKKMLSEFCFGIKTGMTYGNARTLKELRDTAEFMEVTNGYTSESGVR